MRDAAQPGAPGRHLDCDLEAVLLDSFLDGLTLQALLEPEDYTPERQMQLIGAYLEGRGLRAPSQPQANGTVRHKSLVR